MTKQTPEKYCKKSEIDITTRGLESAKFFGKPKDKQLEHNVLPS